MASLQSPSPVLVVDLYPPEREALVALLESLSEEDLVRPTVCPGWTVKDVALHVLGGDLNNLSRRRDGFHERLIGPADDLVTYLNQINNAWVQGARRLSRRVVVDLLRKSGEETYAYFASLDPFSHGSPVSWVGIGSASVWLDLAREYTERWVHQQQIRDAVGRPGLTEPRFLAPVLATFVRALPRALREVNMPDGAGVVLEITGESGGIWTGVREQGSWTLMAGQSAHYTALVSVDQDLAWRIFTRGVSAEYAQPRVRSAGDQHLISAVLNMVSIIA